MCLQIFIKEEEGFYLTYIPDAKAVTDAPDTLLVLMKQRRRWMNGALFAAWRVISNWTNMTGLRQKTKHPCQRLVGIALFMIYMLLNQLLQFFIVGSFFVAIKIFFTQAFAAISVGNSTFLTNFFQNTGGLTFSTVFSFVYISLLGFAIVISLAAPLERGIGYFKLIGGIFAVFTVFSLIGIIIFL
mmetsp:Transcript_15193/g.23460  ORF Transcript_15193/g.23460 Transcript_15193/m.23460 type:complete len:186 (-) Transcript_15193:1545-2102(-)